ncbi:PREDICTED: GTP-binding protein ERG [Fragaria vesca subsp. vesca]|uniref:GTP-binding protein ERG n=1 Tax=Fragaria vesca subsp. vesca TaxID=101020 RepID=UPI0002C2E89A|nr:PREDICTED: GTP-binding protein ERG [Fragaria vesca subsp. vesca]
MKSLLSLRLLSSKPTTPLSPPLLLLLLLRRSFSAQPQHSDPTSTPSSSSESDSEFDFNSTHYDLPTALSDPKPQTRTWDSKYRSKADRVVPGDEAHKAKLRFLKEEEDERRRRVLAKALLEAALERGDEEEDEEEEEVVKEEDQKSVTVGIIGAPNAGKSALTNYLVGTKVSAVSRKTNTTTHEVLGVITEGDTQICFFDTPGLSINTRGIPYKDFKARVESTWSSVNLYDVLIVIFDVHRHLTRPDVRVIRTIKRMGMEPHPTQKRVLCMNKVDLVEKKKDLLTVAEQFKDLPGYDRHFMISGLKGYGVKDLTEYLMLQAVKRPWEEDPFTMSEEVLKNISLEVVREKLLDHMHQEIPYDIDHRLIDWKELRDGSIRIEQHFITHKPSQRKILVGKRGAKIGRIGIEANEELRSIFKRDVHLFLQVRLK